VVRCGRLAKSFIEVKLRNRKCRMRRSCRHTPAGSGIRARREG
jgi:hypothetical protein